MALFSGWRRLDGFEFHVIIAIVLYGAVWYFARVNPFVLLGVNTIGWIAWEVWQGVRDDKGPLPWSGRWGWRKRWEMVAPIIAGGLATAVVEMLLT